LLCLEVNLRGGQFTTCIYLYYDMQQKILLIEDEPSISANLEFALNVEGFGSAVCTTAAAGLSAMRSEQFALICLDIGLPDRSGIEVCREIRGFSQIPILFLTARSGEIDRILGLELGADDYVTKPFSPREVVSRIKAILRRVAPERQIHPEATLPSVNQEHALLTINKNTRMVLLNSTEIVLSFYEFEILCVLFARPNWVYSRDALLSRIWECPDMVTERTIDSHVKSLRRKLSQAYPEQLIITHRSAGYSLKLP
jgi:two-component system, OmpR family, catabolic regulation response regulator CreB